MFTARTQTTATMDVGAVSTGMAVLPQKILMWSCVLQPPAVLVTTVILKEEFSRVWTGLSAVTSLKSRSKNSSQERKAVVICSGLDFEYSIFCFIEVRMCGLELEHLARPLIQCKA